MDRARRWQSRLADYFAWSSPRDGRWILPAILLAYFATYGMLHAARGRVAAWETLGVSGGALSFIDTRFIIATMESERAGQDPYVDNPGDQWGRQMNYPRVWLALAPLGLSERHTVPVAIGLAVAYFACVLCWAGRTNPAQSLVLAAFLCSPHIMWVVERGNVDMVILILLASAVTLVRWEPRLRPLLPLSVLLGGILKLYPIAGIWVAASGTLWRAAAWIVAVIAIFGLYLALTWSDVMHTFASTPRWIWWSYGRMVVFEALARLLRFRAGVDVPHEYLVAASVLAVAATVVVAALLARRMRATPRESPIHLDGFLIASGIYAGTFLIGTNFDYKLIFLILLMPQMFEWLKDRDGFRVTAYALLAALVLSTWLEFLVSLARQRDSSWPSASGEVLQEIANWGLLLVIMTINLRIVRSWTVGLWRGNDAAAATSAPR